MEKDFTIKNEHRVKIRFDNFCEVEIYVNMESLQVITQVTDNPSEKRYVAVADLEEQEV